MVSVVTTKNVFLRNRLTCLPKVRGASSRNGVREMTRSHSIALTGARVVRVVNVGSYVRQLHCHAKQHATPP
jgi:hypothetical protein